MKFSDVIIVGGGIIGCACARKLAQSGLHVTLLESRSRLASEASGASVGTITYQPSSLMPDKWHSLAKNATEEHRTLESELPLEVNNAPKWNWTGHITAATSALTKSNLKKRFRIDHKLDPDIIWLDKKGLNKKEPNITPLSVGAIYQPDAGWVDAVLLAEKLAESAKNDGVDIYCNKQVSGLIYDKKWVVGCYDQDNQAWHAGAVLIAAGAWSHLVDENTQIDLEPIRGQAMHLDLGRKNLIHHLISAKGIYMIPEAGGITIGATYERAGFQRGTTAKAIHRLLTGAFHLLPALEQAAWEKTRIWYGFRPLGPDRIPLIGPDKRYKNLYWATGHYASGTLLAPLTATLINDLIADGKLSELLTTLE